MSIAAGVSLKIQERALELCGQRRSARLGGGGQRKYSVSETVFAISAKCVRRRAALFMLTSLCVVGRMARACFYNSYFF